MSNIWELFEHLNGNDWKATIQAFDYREVEAEVPLYKMNQYHKI
jgi:hypothetical protein